MIPPFDQWAARSLTGLAYLGNVSSSHKMKLSEDFNVLSYILYLAPANKSGYNVCPMSTESCRALCLAESGHARMDHRNRIARARVKKTKLFFEQRDFFMSWMIEEISTLSKRAAKKGMGFSVRLNGTSDISPLLFQVGGSVIMDLFPEIPFYDYTKVPNRIKLLNRFPNYDLTFSYSGQNWEDCQRILDSKLARVAVVFEQDIPKQFKGYPVINGDQHDLRYLDDKGVIVGLKYKQTRTKLDIDKQDFVVPARATELITL
jgi:hypothetical protein